MYSYTYDPDSGGLLLNSTPTGFSREPRPVYAAELDLFGFDAHWRYERQNEAPYLWAEANVYYYRNRKVALLKGGDLYQAPEIVLLETPEPDGAALRPVDIPTMCARNAELLQIIEQVTVKRIIAVYEKYKDKLDIFHVAYSGGKDSAVLLDLVAKALPRDAFVVVFGDTGMEFPDTYRAVDETERRCEEQHISFYRAKSHLPPQESWKLFGPPSQTIRWCCSVHKGAPQVFALRSALNNNNYRGLAFTGVRAHESIARNDYTDFNYEKKNKGQYSHNAILEWTSAEVWLYAYTKNLPINQTYIKGNARAGCLLCPMGRGRTDYVKYTCYPSEIDLYLVSIKESIGLTQESENTLREYFADSRWSFRRSGRELFQNPDTYTETDHVDGLRITMISPSSEWKEWMKTIGPLTTTPSGYTVFYQKHLIPLRVDEYNDKTVISVAWNYLSEHPELSKLLRYVFRKAAYCIGCKACESNCSHGCVSFADRLYISNGCTTCHKCHEVQDGCLVYASRKTPKEGVRKMALDSFNSHAPKPEWIEEFFDHPATFVDENSLGTVQLRYFKKFLKEAGLLIKNKPSALVELIAQNGWDSETSWGILLVNLAINPQILWYIRNLPLDRAYPRRVVVEMLEQEGESTKQAGFIISSFNRLTLTPLGTALHFGQVDDEGNLLRTKCVVSDARVVLYALYTFAEQCNGFWEFSLTRLLQHDMDQDGVSPTEIFGLDREDMQPILLGLAAKYPAFIGATFTHNLDKITLNSQKTSADVLGLF